MSACELLHTLLWGYPAPPEMIDPRYPLWLQTYGGLWLSLLLTGISLCLGAAGGVVLALCRNACARSREWPDRLAHGVLRYGSAAIVESIRGLPVMLWVLLIFYLPYRMIEYRVPGVLLATAAFALYAGVYCCEIIRAGLRAVQPGWIDAAKVLGLSRTQRLWRIELPIVLRTMLPDLLNLGITVFKDTSVLAVVGVAELTYTARQIQMSEPVQYASVLLLTLALYWLIATLLGLIVGWLGRRSQGLGPVADPEIALNEMAIRGAPVLIDRPAARSQV